MATYDKARLDWLNRQLCDPLTGSIGDVSFYGTWGAASMEIGDPRQGGARYEGADARECIDNAMAGRKVQV